MQPQNRKENLIVLKILLCGFIVLAFAVAVWIGLGRYEFLQKQKQSKKFIGQIINSVIANTEFYKNNSKERVLKDIESCRTLMSNDYVISTIDYSWEIYEAKILFHNKTSIKVDISFRDNKPILSHFRKLRNEYPEE